MTPCSTCQFFVLQGDGTWGECHCNAPPSISYPSTQPIPDDTRSHWPRVLATDACGDGKAKA